MDVSYYGQSIDRRGVMQSVTVSPKFQVVIPKKIRNALHISPGQKLQVIQYGNRIEFIPERHVDELMGFLSGIDTNIGRDEDRT